MISPQTKTLLQVFTSVLMFQIIHSMFNMAFPFLLQELVGSKAKTLHIKSIFDAVRVVIAAIMIPLYGTFSDKFGRRPLLLWLLLMSLVQTGCLFLGQSQINWPIYIFAKLFGYLSSPYLVFGWSIMADVGESKLRATHFGFLGASYGGGLLIGPRVAKLLNDTEWYALYLFCGLLTLVNALFVWFVFQESLPTETRSKELFPLKAILEIIKDPIAGTKFIILCVISFLYSFGDQDIQATLSLFVESRFGWTPKTEIPTLFMVIGSLLIFWQMIGIPILAVLGKRSFFLPIALVIASFGHVIISVSETPWVFYVGLILGSISAICHVYINSTVSTAVGPAHQALLMGFIESIFSVAGLFGALVADNVFGALVENKNVPRWLTGGQFFITAFCWIICAILASYLCYLSWKRNQLLGEPLLSSKTTVQ